ncbi:MAG: hypothetical protein JNJ92_09885 [Altererythrobacter sp.]|nr:hypothetical protein [Altererythrobacter sp.]
MKLTRSIMMAGAMLLSAPLAMPMAASAQEFPLVAGDFTSVSGIFIEDGGTLAYAQFLASQWAKQQEFAKSKGWISDYRIYINVDARDGEPTVYLTTTSRDIPNGAEWEKRNLEWTAWTKKSDAQLDAESGDRAKFRKLRGTMLLQEFTVRK